MPTEVMLMKKLWLILAVVLIAAFALVGCAARPETSLPSNPGTNAGSSNDSVTTDPLPGGNVAGEDRKIVYEIDASYRVASTTDALAVVKNAMAEGEWTDYESGGGSYAYLTVRIRTERLDAFLAAIAPIGERTQYEKRSVDVTGSYADLESRLAMREAEYASLADLLERATDFSEILAVNTRMREVEAEIDSIKRALASYDARIDYSTVRISLYAESVDPPVSFGQQIDEASKSGWNAFVGFFRAVAVGIAISYPFLIVIAAIVAVVIVIVVIVRRKNKKKQSGIPVLQQQDPQTGNGNPIPQPVPLPEKRKPPKYKF